MAGEVRQPINVESLNAYLSNHVPEIAIPVKIKQFGFGQSNPTYQLTDRTGMRYVLRKKPPGKLLSRTAHRVDREYRIIDALQGTDVPVPRAYCLCEDDSVIGTPFYVMSFLDGRIFEDPTFPGVSPAERYEMWHDAIRTLAKLHRIDPASIGLESYGKASGFYNRQLQTFNTISNSQAQTEDIDTKKPVGKIPHFDDMQAFFRDPKMQPRDRGTLIHGDYKIDNLVYHKTKPIVIGILDWEMSTIGHPLSDLANLSTPYVLANVPEGSGIRDHPEFRPGVTPGIPYRGQCIQWYREVAGWDPSIEMPWGDAFGIFRGSIIMQGIAARSARRQASSAKAHEYIVQMAPFGEFAWSLIERVREGFQSKANL
ncbi:APH-domain-containing protein [Xylona heveae TC161]|uniref:APH-domain-containing protein n=1 Tax=Xylona heveae (strain CBS 132557 / TC161) TaxID=1328760 RepID=A0A165J8J1_XYLHT|nr:APH-domain-containing protein [Xylona heveae TC161]KZF25894.1 APH-domain-containing protein [Xylona heveae TC161]